MSLQMMRGTLVFFVASAYIVLNEGLMILLIPPTQSGLPIGELVLALVALTFVFELRHLPGFVQVAPIMALTVWWALGATQAALGFSAYGVWALRDATNVIESLYLWVGFVVASHPAIYERYGRWLRILIVILIAYNLLYPLKDALVKLSPTITAPAGYSTYIFFKYNSGSLGLLTAAVWVLVDRVKFMRIPPWALAGSFIVFSIAFFQMRTTYLQILALLIAFSFLQPRTVLQMSGGMVIGIFVLMILLASGLEITGRLGAKFTMEFFWDHIAAIWGAKGESAEVAGAAGGVGQRVKWWSDIWINVTSSIESLMFGLGYGFPLTSFKYYDGQIVREPHNSVVSVFARLGLVGITAFLWVQISLFLIWYRTYRRMRETGETEWANSLLIMGTFFVMVWIGSLGEDAFEKPFNTVPYYFFWGVVLQARWRQIAVKGRSHRYNFGALPARVRA